MKVEKERERRELGPYKCYVGNSNTFCLGPLHFKIPVKSKVKGREEKERRKK